MEGDIEACYGCIFRKEECTRSGGVFLKRLIPLNLIFALI
jgi:hypothetical protein